MNVLYAMYSYYIYAAGETPYNITVKALNLAGCGKEKQLYCFTQEGGIYKPTIIYLYHCSCNSRILLSLSVRVCICACTSTYTHTHTHTHTHIHTSVPPSPMNVKVVRFDSTTIGVDWTKFTLVELKGLASYIVTYSIVIDSRKRQLGRTITVPWTENHVIIPNLQPGAQYDITVSTSTQAGMSGIPLASACLLNHYIVRLVEISFAAPASGHEGANGVSTPPPIVPTVPSSSANTVAIIGGVVAVVFIIAIAITTAIIIIVALVLRSRRADFEPKQE